MQREINVELINRLPFDIVVNHILPYTYNIQPPRLLRDIRSFCADYSFLENIYAFDFNYDVLFYDLTCFCNRTRHPNFNMHEDFGSLLRRLFRFKHYTYSQLNNIVFILFHRNAIANPIRKIRMLWALFKPKERTLFINRYLSENYF
jgi:hypothetical protein